MELNYLLIYISSRRTNTIKHSKCLYVDVDEKIKSWTTNLCQSSAFKGECVTVVHDFSPGRRIEAGAAFFKEITYSAELGHGLFKLQYAVDNTVITVRGRMKHDSTSV